MSAAIPGPLLDLQAILTATTQPSVADSQPIPTVADPTTTTSLSLTSDSNTNEEELDFRLPNCKVVPTGLLGGGAYSDVVEVEYKGKKYAAKKYRQKYANLEMGKLIKLFGREHEVLSLIRHQNIVPYYGICQLATDNATVIVMERMEMNLSDFLKDSKNASISITRKLQILHDVACGLNHLHIQRPAIIHRDLTATNVLLNSKGVAKISDFGNSCVVDLRSTPELMTVNPGTFDYMAPEALSGEYNEKLDIFSFGHLSIFVMIQRHPYPLQQPTYKEHGCLVPRTEVERRSTYLDEVKTKLPEGEQNEMYSIIIKCLENEADMRPSCTDILSSNVFAHVQK